MESIISLIIICVGVAIYYTGVNSAYEKGYENGYRYGYDCGFDEAAYEPSQFKCASKTESEKE